jgi:acetylornithine deacetylase/succinyl-diaminopimelate desuccinylase-like protein
MTPEEITASVKAAMPQVMAELAELVSHASCAFPGFPGEPVHAARASVMRILANAGCETRELDLGAGYPAVWGEIPAPEGAPTVLMYAHYDIQPAPMEQGWLSDPFKPVMRDGRLYGRGAADDKSGVAIHAATLRAFGGKPPVGVKLLIEGEEETRSNLEAFVEKNPDMFRADVMVIADMGNITVGEPVLTTTLRGHVQCIVEVRTVDHALHSGLFGGPAPDAFVALIRLLNSLWDEHGNTVVPGLTAFPWPGAEYPEELYRELAGMLPGVEVIGNGSVASKLWSKPNASVIGIDGPPSIAEAGNVLLPCAKAKVALRIAPGADPRAELAKLDEYLVANAPWGVVVDVHDVKASDAFIAPKGGPAMMAAAAALTSAFGKQPSEVGSGGSIPLLETLAKASPGAEFILWGAEDALANIHGGNESVHPDEIERMAIAQALLLSKLGGA